MKILTVNTSDIQGGAAQAAYRLHNSLLAQDIESQMLVQEKSSDDWTVESLPISKIQKGFSLLRSIIDNIPVKFYKNRTETLFSPSWLGFSNIVNRINELNPDIVHFHWICGGMINIKKIAKINAPIVWSLHDMWAFTGGCHYDENCSGYIKDCKKCKVLGVESSALSSKGLKRKERVYAIKKNIYLVPTSTWIEKMARKSHFCNHLKGVLYNPLDLSLFKKISKKSIRKYFNIEKNRKVVLFGAASPFSDKRKGFKELSEALKLLKNKDILLFIIGATKPKELTVNGFEVKYIPYLKDEISLPLIYNAADVTVVPSLQETFGQMSSESLACETPVVGFDSTGTADIVDHKKNGYLAKPFSPEDLAVGIEWILNSSDYDELCLHARKKVLREFDSGVVARKYINLYKEIIDDY
jgi:glycosyltransferase involved in cell wall biosynthesis